MLPTYPFKHRIFGKYRNIMELLFNDFHKLFLIKLNYNYIPKFRNSAFINQALHRTTKNSSHIHLTQDVSI